MPAQGFRPDGQKVLFDLVAVGDDAAEKDGAGAGNIGKAMAQEAARAGFRHGKGVLPRGQELNEDQFQRVVVGPENDRAEQLFDPASAFGQQGGGFFPASGQADVHFANAGAIGQFQTVADQVLQRAGDFFFDDGFAQAGGFEGVAEEWEGEGKFAVEERDDGSEEHGPQFARRAGQEDEALVAGGDVQGQAGGGAVGIGEDGGAFGDHGLDLDIGGHGTAARGKELFDPGEGGRVEDQFAAEGMGGKLAGEVVAGGAEAAGDEDEIGTAQRLAEGGLDARAVVGDAHLAGDFVAEVGELAAKPLLVGVEDAPDQEFGAGVDEFDAHFQGIVN